MNEILARAARMFTWKHWAWAIALGAGLGLLVPLQTLHLNTHVWQLRIVFSTPWYIGAACLFMVAVVCAEASDPSGRGPGLSRYVIAAAVASVIWIALVYAFRDLNWVTAKRQVIGDLTPHIKDFSGFPTSAIVVTHGFEGLVHGWLATLVYVRLRSMRVAARLLSEAEMERAVASRDLLDAQLKATEGEINPQALLGALDDIEALHPSDPAEADARLDALIARLRAAVPRVRTREEGLPSHAA